MEKNTKVINLHVKAEQKTEKKEAKLQKYQQKHFFLPENNRKFKK